MADAYRAIEAAWIGRAAEYVRARTATHLRALLRTSYMRSSVQVMYKPTLLPPFLGM